MSTSFVYLLALSNFLFSQTLTAASAFTPGSEASAFIALTAGLINSTLGIPTPPDEFGLSYEIGGPKLRITSCLMNTIAALKELALADFDAKVIDGTEYRLDNYPEVSIVMTTPKRKRNVQVRFVMWAICLGVYDMVMTKKFEFGQFEMTWNKQVLGWVQIVNHQAGVGSTTEQKQANGTLTLGSTSATPPGSNGTIGLEPFNITNVLTNDNADDPDEARLNVIFAPFGDTLGVYDVFLPVMSGLTDVAQFPSTHETTGLIIGLQPFKGFICVLPLVPPRTSPPFLEYRWLIRSITRLPSYMLEQGRFGEVNMKITVDGEAVAYGRMTMKPDCDPDPSLPASLGATEN